MSAEYGLVLRGREAAVAGCLSAAGISVAAFAAPVLTAFSAAPSAAFTVGLLTRLTGPLLASTAVRGILPAGITDLEPFSARAMAILVTAVCVLMAVSGGGGLGSTPHCPRKFRYGTGGSAAAHMRHGKKLPPF